MEYSGSGGGNGGGQGGPGAGFLIWNVGELMEMNGELLIRGADGSGANAGGGSGGSLLIRSMNMSGHGLVSVSGGAGVGSGGGGAGGRVAIHCVWRYQYGGTFHNYGGLGGSTHAVTHSGAAGTTYVEENLREIQYREKKYDKAHNSTYLDVDHKLIFTDNHHICSPAPTLLMANETFHYEINELYLTGCARMMIYHPVGSEHVTVIAHLFLGDKTGQLHIRSRQHVYVEYIVSVSNRTEAPCSFIIEYEGEIIVPVEVHMQGTNSTLKGLVTGVESLFIESDTFVEFWSTANTALLKNGTYTDVTDQGNFAFGLLVVKLDGLAGFAKITDVMHLETSVLEVKYKGELYMNDADIVSGFAEIESQGTFHLNGRGYGAEMGPGAGKTIGSNNYGTGASHGGYAGGLYTFKYYKPQNIFPNFFYPHMNESCFNWF